jgi:phage tail sheath gpL-like
MPIVSQLPQSKRRPGAFHQFKFQPSPGLIPLQLRLAIIAEKSSTGTAAVEVPVQVFDADDADTKCGKGSFAALMVRDAFAQANLGGIGCPEVWVCPSVEPAAGTAMIETLTITGPATEAGNIVFKIANVTITVGISNGDAQNTIAAAIEAAVDAIPHLVPVSASVAANVVSLTCRTKGIHGNDIAFEVVSKPAGVGAVFAQNTAGAGSTPITNPLAALFNQRYHAIAMNNHATGDAAVLLAHVAEAWGFAQENYRFVFLGERGSLGTAQTLQAALNDYRLAITSCEGSPSLPGTLAVATAVAEFSRDQPNANLDGERTIVGPPAASLAYTDTEVESALNGGVTPLTPDGTVYTKIERLVTTQTAVGGVAFEPLRDIAYPRTAAYMAEQIDIGFAGFRQEVLDDDPDADIRQRVRDMVIEKHRAAQTSRILRDVDSFLDEITVEFSPTVPGRLVIFDPFRVAGPLHQGDFIHVMYQ